VIRDLFLALGPAWIKIGQIVATRSDLLPSPLLDALRPLQDDVPPMRAARVSAILRKAYGGRAPFAMFDERPIAAGSVAQVHRATLPDGTAVALKLLRPGIGAGLDRNLAILIALARGAALLRPTLCPLQVAERIADLRPSLLNQADLAREALEMEAIRENFENHPFVQVPRTFGEHCRPDVLVMSFAGGFSWRGDGSPDLPRKLLARRLVDAFQTMIYLHGRFHADAHPGNLLFSREGKITLLDFGLVGEIDEAERWALASFYYAVIRKEWVTAARRYTDAFAVNRRRIEASWSAFEAEITECLKKHFETRLKWSTAEFTRDTVQIFEAYGARIDALGTDRTCACFARGAGDAARSRARSVGGKPQVQRALFALPEHRDQSEVRGALRAFDPALARGRHEGRKPLGGAHSP
jgi:glutamate-1-semialdehyde 2,1-aminomutase